MAPVASMRRRAADMATKKKFKCSQCERMFSRAEHRARHELSHSDDRPYKCTKCVSTFVRRDLLLRHVRTVHAAANNNSTNGEESNASARPKRRRQHVKEEESPQPMPPECDDRLLSLVAGSSAEDVSTAMFMTEMHNSPRHSRHSSYYRVSSPGEGGRAALPASMTGSMTGPLAGSLTGNPLSGNPLAGSANEPGSVTASGDAGNMSMNVMRNYGAKISNGLNGSIPDPVTGSIPDSINGSINAPIDGSISGSVNGSVNGSINGSMSRSRNGSMNGSLTGLRDNGHSSPAHSHSSGKNPLGKASEYNLKVEGGMKPLSKTEIQAISKLFQESVWSERAEVPPKMLPQQRLHAPPAPSVGGLSIPQLEPDLDVMSLVKVLRQLPSGHMYLPNRLQLDRYLGAYFTFVQPMVPLLHPTSFRCGRAAPALLFAICALGAAVCHERAMANLLSYNARVLVSLRLRYPSTTMGYQPPPMGTVQALVLVMYLAALNGDRVTLEMIAPLRTVLARSVLQLAQDMQLTFHPPAASLDDKPRWAEREQGLRTVYCAYFILAIHSAMYNFPPALQPDDLPHDLPLPCSEGMWHENFHDPEAWGQAARAMRAAGSQPIATFGDLLDLLRSRRAESPSMLDALTLRTLAATISIEGDPSRCGARLWVNAAKDPSPGTGQGGLSSLALGPFVHFIEALGVHCGGTLANESRVISGVAALQHPLIVSSHVLVDLTELRTAIDLSIVRENLQYGDPQAVADAAVACLSRFGTQQQLDAVLPFVLLSFDAIAGTVTLGPNMLAVFMASPISLVVGHTLVLDFEMLLASIMWVHRASLAATAGPEQQMQTLAWLEQSCARISLHRVGGSLAPAIAEAAAQAFDTVRAWGVTEVMAAALRVFANGLLTT